MLSFNLNHSIPRSVNVNLNPDYVKDESRMLIHLNNINIPTMMSTNVRRVQYSDVIERHLLRSWLYHQVKPQYEIIMQVNLFNFKNCSLTVTTCHQNQSPKLATKTSHQNLSPKRVTKTCHQNLSSKLVTSEIRHQPACNRSQLIMMRIYSISRPYFGKDTVQKYLVE